MIWISKFYGQPDWQKCWLVNFIEDTVFNYACADAFGLTALTTMMEIHWLV